LIPILLTLKAPADARRVVVANLLVRGGGAVLVLWAFGSNIIPYSVMGATSAVQAMTTHVGFNAAILAIAIPFSQSLTRAAGFVRDPPAPNEIDITALDPAALADPRRALGCARREILRMGEEIEAMPRAKLPLYRSWDDTAAEDLLCREARVDRMHFRSKLYLSRLMRTSGTVNVLEPAAELATLACQLEAAARRDLFDDARHGAACPRGHDVLFRRRLDRTGEYSRLGPRGVLRRRRVADPKDWQHDPWGS
jgi:phosphate:Na+ symporter